MKPFDYVLFRPLFIKTPGCKTFDSYTSSYVNTQPLMLKKINCQYSSKVTVHESSWHQEHKFRTTSTFEVTA